MFVFGSNAAGGYNLTDSVRFRSSASAYLSRTPTSAGDLQKWTWSSWIKRGVLGGTENFFSQTGGGGTSQRTYFLLGSNNTLTVAQYNGASIDFQLTTTQVFRDPSAWYHIVVAADTTQATASNRLKIYINGEQVSAFSTSTYPSLNLNTYVNSTNTAGIGYDTKVASRYFDGYMTEINHIDGQALTPSDFGETDTTTGVWKPKEYTGTYGTNGFYLPMKATTQAEGFNTVLWTGNGTSQSINGVGFSPDLVWVKSRSGAYYNMLQDTVRGAGKSLFSNTTLAEVGNANDLITSFDSDGFTVNTTYLGGYNETTNNTSSTYVGWCWEAGGTAVANTVGDIESQVSANTAKGFSVVTYTGNGTAGATFGHGLSSAPSMVIVKSRTSGSAGWLTYHSSLGEDYYLQLNLTNASAGPTASAWNNTAPSSSVVTLGSGTSVNTSGHNYVAYCFAEVSGFSKFGSYTGNGSTTGPTVTTGFRPAFVLIKQSSSSGTNWMMYDNTRSVANPANNPLTANTTNTEATSTNQIDFNSDGFQITGSSGGVNTSGSTYIYMAFADTRDFQWNFDASGNKNNWTATNINSNASSETTYDIMSDVPTLTDEDTANFATLNPISNLSNGTISNGNLNYASSASWMCAGGTIFPSSGKWYFEGTLVSFSSSFMFGVINTDFVSWATYPGASAYGWTIQGTSSGTGTWNNNVPVTLVSGEVSATNDIFMVAYDVDAGKIWFGKNGTWYSSGNPSAGTNAIYTNLSGALAPVVSTSTTSDTVALNCGQRPFAYTPPTGFKKLNTYNLPDSAVKDGSQYMNPVIYTGDGASSRSITGLGFSPDLVWVKQRNIAQSHTLTDSVTGTGKIIATDAPNGEYTGTTYGQLSSFDSDGFTASKGSDPTYSYYNISGGSYVAWNWRGSDSSAVTDSSGTIGTVTRSTNTTSGFSVVTYTGTGTSGQTIPHGLGVTPSLIITKRRDTTGNWIVMPGNSTLLGGSYILVLNSTAAKTSNTSYYAGYPGVSSYYSSTDATVNASGGTYMSYVFAEVEGFSKFGSYTGNGSTDGTFVYTGFRPAFLLLKVTSTTDNWMMWDGVRSPENLADNGLQPNSSGAEATGNINQSIDLLSNGFKCRNTNEKTNYSGYNYIYMAFAENPFKNSLAR